MKPNKTIPALWFHTLDGKARHVTEYYKNIFDKDFVSMPAIALGETPSGYTELCNITMFEQDYFIMTTAIEHNRFNDAFAIMIHCDDQQEIDKYWDYFTKEGKESQCGWCIDKFGLRWQIVPVNMDELMSQPNAESVMMNQTRIIIEEYYR